jgi:hypothetical protein
MDSRRWLAFVLLLFFLGIPASGRAEGGPKNWFHRKDASSGHYRGDHIVVKHHPAKHLKPQHATRSSR